MRNEYPLRLDGAEFRWLRAWINAGVSPEPEGARILGKIEDLAAQDNRPQRIFPLESA